jgi:hypothetical protein
MIGSFRKVMRAASRMSNVASTKNSIDALQRSRRQCRLDEGAGRLWIFQCWVLQC